MKMIATILDGHARVHLAATRAPDLLRRQLAAQTGCATLVAVALAPPGLGADALVARVDERLHACRLAPGVYAIAPGAVVRAAARIRIAYRIRALQVRVAGWVRRRLRRLLDRAEWTAGARSHTA